MRGPDFGGTKQKAIEDAKKMQHWVSEECTRLGKEMPNYQLSELIGKGSYGRVYKAKSLSTNQLVAVKIIDIEESDTLNPRQADTYGDLLKEISALQLLSDSGAKNINHVVEALPVGQAMWLITEYCAGGSVATLMRPTAPGGLQEKWIIPILREVAEGIHWVHSQGVIHRDLKCANVLVTEVGDVQICDFGVAGVIETKFDKRTTFIGTAHWMAPELFDQSTSYGTEIDIWAYGSMVYEIASGFPPNFTAGIDFSRLGNHLKHHTPKLDGDQYSSGLKDLVSYCLQQDPERRPTVEMVQRHKYIFMTEESYPKSTLSHLVRGFKLWEAQGGDRRSLFSAGGAQAPTDLSLMLLGNDEWNFSTTAAFDQQLIDSGDAQDVYDAYGTNVDFSQQVFEETVVPQKGKARRRPPPQLPTVKAPLEKIFDPNTLSSYEDNSRVYYGRPFAIPASDLPLRDDSLPTSDVRESLIDLDASLHGSELSAFTDMNTIRAGDGHGPGGYDFMEPYDVQPPLSDPEDFMQTSDKNNRRTQDWKFPTVPVSSFDSVEQFRFPRNDGPPLETRPPLLHHPTEPVQPSSSFNDLAIPKSEAADNRVSVGSLIDLDMSFADSSTDYTRPSTSHSDVGSISGSEVGGANPFELEKHASLYVMRPTNREPSIYVSDDSDFAGVVTDFSAADDMSHDVLQEDEQTPMESRPYSLGEFADTDPEYMSEPDSAAQQYPTSFHGQGHDDQLSQSWQFPKAPLPLLPDGPSLHVMQGQASSDDVKEELRRLALSLGDHLSHANVKLADLPVRRNSTMLESVGDAI